jgi:hypothetical protein
LSRGAVGRGGHDMRLASRVTARASGPIFPEIRRCIPRDPARPSRRVLRWSAGSEYPAPPCS